MRRLRIVRSAFVIVPLIVFLLIISTTNAGGLSETSKQACVEYGNQYCICPELLMAIIEKESGGNPNAENNGCKGLMQIYEKYHTDRMARLGVTNLYDERSNVLVGTDYISELFKKYNDVATVLMVYHGEKNAVQKGNDSQISDYASSILERSAELERENGK